MGARGMSMIVSILDTNVLVRFLVGDNAPQRAQAERWFKEAEHGRRAIIVSPLVIAETSFVLESFYKQKRGAVADTLEVVVSQRWLNVEERTVMLKALSYYRRGLHFVDSYLRAWTAVHGGEILTFDKDLKKNI